MRSKLLLLAGMGMFVGFAMPQDAIAQEDEGPPTRIVTMTTWDVPFGDQGVFFDWYAERILPVSQLNPNVLNSRVMTHRWGSNAAQVVVLLEYESMETLAAGCGQPCEDYFDAHPAPEEGEEGYEEYQEGLEAFQKYYSHHTDEIYEAFMPVAKVEGELMGPIGGPDDEDEGDDN